MASDFFRLRFGIPGAVFILTHSSTWGNSLQSTDTQVISDGQMCRHLVSASLSLAACSNIAHISPTQHTIRTAACMYKKKKNRKWSGIQITFTLKRRIICWQDNIPSSYVAALFLSRAAHGTAGARSSRPLGSDSASAASRHRPPIGGGFLALRSRRVRHAPGGD